MASLSEGIANMRIEELHPSIYCSWMIDNGTFARMGVIGDGSCFFHSVCALTNRQDYLHQNESKQKDIAYAFRCDFGKKFTEEEYKRLSKPSTQPKDHYDDGFCSPKVWADELMINVVSKALNLNLIFLDLRNGKAYCGVHGKESLESKNPIQKTGIVAWVDHRHFEPIVRVDDAKKGLITTLFSPSTSAADAKVVKQIMDLYAGGCPMVRGRSK
jgi:hypothetical protein